MRPKFQDEFLTLLHCDGEFLSVPAPNARRITRPISPHVPEKVVKITAVLLFGVHSCLAVLAKTFLK